MMSDGPFEKPSTKPRMRDRIPVMVAAQAERSDSSRAIQGMNEKNM